ncbi:MAG: hypothetical protein RL291_132 [Pseudomonadota bacterium]
MRLGDWLKKNDVTYEAFGARVGASRQRVGHWVSGENVPRPETMIAITRETGGEVTANDFMPSAGDGSDGADTQEAGAAA